MEFYKSDRVFSKIGLKYSGLKIEAGDEGKVILVRPDLISVLWDKDKRQIARLTPSNDVIKSHLINYEDFKKKYYYNKLIKNEKDLIKTSALIDVFRQTWERAWTNHDINKEIHTERYDNILKRFGNKIKNTLFEDNKERNNLLSELESLMGEEHYDRMFALVPDMVRVASFKLAQNPKTLAKQFMSEEDYENFSKLIDLRKLYSEENIGRNMEGFKGTKNNIKDINEKIDSILDKYKNVIMSEFDLKAKENYINKIVKNAKEVKKWKKERDKKESLKSQSIDRSNKKEDVEVDNVKPDESNVTDYGQEPLQMQQERQ